MSVSTPRQQVLMVAPHWGHPGHLGGRRTERFRRWLVEAGDRVAVVRGGSRDASRREDWGRVIVVRDPLGFYRDGADGDGLQLVPRPPNPLRRILAHVALVPEPTAMWSQRVLRSPIVRQAAWRADLVLASSPPESSLVAAEALARDAGSRFVADLRDGWLDEPMIPLADLPIQRSRHARLERRVIRGARATLVTSDVWRELLLRRYPEVAERCWTLSNPVPPTTPVGSPPSDGPYELIYPGRVGSSRPERSVEQLLEPLLGLADQIDRPVRVGFLGERPPDETARIRAWESPMADAGWQLEVAPPVSGEELPSRLARAHGLLVLSASRASLPAKVFDSLGSGRPIFCVAPEASALHRLSAEIPRLFVATLGGHDAPARLHGFLKSLDAPGEDGVPRELTEKWQKQRFRELVLGNGDDRG
jgi:hypothetical protein